MEGDEALTAWMEQPDRSAKMGSPGSRLGISDSRERNCPLWMSGILRKLGVFHFSVNDHTGSLTFSALEHGRGWMFEGAPTAPVERAPFYRARSGSKGAPTLQPMEQGGRTCVLTRFGRPVQ